MPLIHRRELRPGALFGIWEVTEQEPELLALYPASVHEIEMLESFSYPFRRTQFLAARLLLHTLSPGTKIVYDENGKPWPSTADIHISLSHTSNLIAMMIDNVHCGIDIEVVRPKIERIAKKFLSDEELRQAFDPPAVERLHVYWCVKEAIYKVYGKKSVSLRRDIFVAKPVSTTSGTVRATLNDGGATTERDVHYERFRDCMLAWTEQPI